MVDAMRWYRMYHTILYAMMNKIQLILLQYIRKIVYNIKVVWKLFIDSAHLYF